MVFSTSLSLSLLCVRNFAWSFCYFEHAEKMSVSVNYDFMNIKATFIGYCHQNHIASAKSSQFMQILIWLMIVRLNYRGFLKGVASILCVKMGANKNPSKIIMKGLDSGLWNLRVCFFWSKHNLWSDDFYQSYCSPFSDH